MRRNFWILICLLLPFASAAHAQPTELPAFFLRDFEAGIRPVDPLTLADLPGYEPIPTGPSLRSQFQSGRPHARFGHLAL